MVKAKDSLKLKAFIWGIAGALSYLLFWALVYWIWKRNFPDLELAGSASYESKYPYIFARELIREKHLFFFNNPFGTLDPTPKLLFPFSSALALFYPIWNHHLFFFDHALGCLFSFLLFQELGRWAKKGLPWFWTLCFFIGGSIGSFVSVFYPAREWLKPLFLATQPALLFQPATSWILFQFLVLKCLHKIQQGSLVAAGVLLLILSLLHPFFGVTAAIALIMALVLGRKKRVDGFKTAALLALASVFYLFFVTGYWLPHHSEDARYFYELYNDVNLARMFQIPPILFLAYAGGPLLLYFLNGKKNRLSSSLKKNAPLIAVLVFLLIVTCSPALGLSFVPQSGRWAMGTVYWLSLLLLTEGLESRTSDKKKKLLKLVALMFLLDGVSNVQKVVNLNAYSAHEHFALNHDQKEVLDFLKRQTTGRFIVFRDCHPETLREAGDLEYLVMANTNLTAPAAHRYFTPNQEERVREFSACTDPKAVQQVLSKLSEPAFLLYEKKHSPAFPLENAKEIPLNPDSRLKLYRIH